MPISEMDKKYFPGSFLIGVQFQGKNVPLVQHVHSCNIVTNNALVTRLELNLVQKLKQIIIWELISNWIKIRIEYGNEITLVEVSRLFAKNRELNLHHYFINQIVTKHSSEKKNNSVLKKFFHFYKQLLALSFYTIFWTICQTIVNGTLSFLLC